MAAELVTFKMDSEFLSEVDNISKKAGFGNRTEFIRGALREKIDEIRLKEAMISLTHLKGASKKKTSDEDLERIRKKAFEEIDKRIK